MGLALVEAMIGYGRAVRGEVARRRGGAFVRSVGVVRAFALVALTGAMPLSHTVRARRPAVTTAAPPAA